MKTRRLIDLAMSSIFGNNYSNIIIIKHTFPKYASFANKVITYMETYFLHCYPKP